MTITREQVEALACRLAEETDLCRNDGADDIAGLLDDARSLMLDLWERANGAESLIRWIAEQDYRGNRSIEQGKCIAYLRGKP